MYLKMLYLLWEYGDCMADFNEVSGTSFGSLSSTLGSYNGSRTTSAGSSGGETRTDELVSINLDAFVEPNVEAKTLNI